MKRYKTIKGQLSLPFKNRRIQFSCSEFPNGYYSTSDKEEIAFIEGLKDFGVYITLESETKEEVKTNKEVVEVESWQEAKDYLVAKGFKATEVNTPTKIKNVGEELNIEFKVK